MRSRASARRWASQTRPTLRKMNTDRRQGNVFRLAAGADEEHLLRAAAPSSMAVQPGLSVATSTCCRLSAECCKRKHFSAAALAKNGLWTLGRDGRPGCPRPRIPVPDLR